MKKNFLYGACAMALTLGLASCSSDELAVGGSDGIVTFTAKLPSTISRAYADGTTATTLRYAVYDINGNTFVSVNENGDKEGKATFNNLQATVSVQLAKAKSYKFYFWADCGTGSPYTFDYTNKQVTVDYSSVTGNMESYDAFYGSAEVAVNGSLDQTVTLTRPFAQLNIGTNDLAAAESTGFKASSVTVTVSGLNNAFDLDNGYAVASAVEESPVEFSAANLPSGETFPVSGYDYLSMNYILVGKDKSTTDVTLTVSDGTTTAPTATFATVPVQQNYRTNIYGSLLTNPANFTVVIDPAFNTPDYNMGAWDGTTVTEPAYDATTGVYTVEQASDLAYFLQNGTLSTSRNYSAATTVINLTRDIDFGGNTIPVCEQSYTIENGGQVNTYPHTFAPFTLNGNGYTIRNFKVANYDVTSSDEDRNVGLFGSTSYAEINNLTIENGVVGDANCVGDQYAGVLIGTAHGTTVINNVTVNNSAVTGVNKVGAILGHMLPKDTYSTLTLTNCKVNNSTVKGVGTDAGSLGGLVGYVSWNDATFANCHVAGTTVDASQGTIAEPKRASSLFIGGFNGRQWLGAEQHITIDNCSAEGALFSKYNVHPLIGADRKVDGYATVTIDGKVVSLAADLFITNAAQFIAFRDAVNDGKDYSGKTVKLVADIDLGKVEFKPIGRLVTEGWKYFSGTFDGCGHTISGLLNQTTQSNERQTTVFGRGLFGALKDATICNFTLTDSWVGGTLPISDRPAGNIVGAAVGYAYGNIVIDNVNVTNSTVVGFGKVGGLIGSYQDGQTITITNCSVSNVDIHACQAAAALHGFSCSPEAENNVFGNCAISNVTVNLYNDTRGDNYLINNQWFWKYNVQFEGNYYYYPMAANWYTTLDCYEKAEGEMFYGKSYDTLDGCTGNITLNVNWK
jgi:hypothetical protein